VPRGVASPEKDASQHGTTISANATSPSKSIIESEVLEADAARLWRDMDKLRRKGDYRPNRGEPVSAVAVSADNLWVFSASHDDVIRMYSLDEMRVVRSIQVPGAVITCLLPLPDNRTVLLGSNEGLASHSIEYGRTSSVAAVHRDAVSCLDWRPGLLATGSADGTVCLWQCGAANGHSPTASDALARLEHSSPVSCLALSPDKTSVVAGTREGAVVLWCTTSKHIIQELPRHNRQVKNAFSDIF